MFEAVKERQQKILPAEFIEADAEALPFEDASFDAATYLETVALRD